MIDFSNIIDNLTLIKIIIIFFYDFDTLITLRKDIKVIIDILIVFYSSNILID